ncbi:FAD-dependent monooxygenase [Streptomyces sp. DSM 42041]|uniref:FAD-dependent monooxygenase n=1 Tax=Streptomyces hazeniae TaxID=3075538 RepID=A0ABU2NS31_9ACTN|nr:FAD-dependent monooxygenase [Streptomyces sp. DSM 42041]MDT0379043.1 FAD-dependent monooxygenase [Streptomyces sp. DSM 42041]
MSGRAVAVVGGSIAGCAAAGALLRGGAARVTVFERADGRLRDRGVGIAQHADRFDELEAAGYVSARIAHVPLTRRVWRVRDGDAPHGRTLAVHPFPFRAYTWGALWAGLRERVPDGVTYRTGSTVVGAETGTDSVRLRCADGTVAAFDAVVGADGYRSVVRDAMFPTLRPAYAGYVGWRGTAPIEPDGAPAPDEACTVVFPGGHCMIYPVPDGSGGRHFNWVLYTAPSAAFQSGLDQPTSLPPGRLATEVAEHLRALVAEHFPPYWARVLLSTPAAKTLVQPIYDLEVPHYGVGRLLLVGDAATVARPHTGGGSVKALQDAVALERALSSSGGSTGGAVAAYDEERRGVGADMVALGRRLGAAQVEATPDWAGLDETGFADWWRDQHGGSDRLSGFGGHALRGR